MAARPSIQRRLTLQALDIEPLSDAELSDDADLENRSTVSISSDSQHYSDVEENTTKTAQERFVVELLEKGIDKELNVTDKDEVDRRMSDLTMGEKSYVMDLGRQKVTREDTIKAEAFEEARVWYKKAIREGMPESTELFSSIFAQLIEETKAKYKERHKNQDEWLNQALDDLEAKLSTEELEELHNHAPSAEEKATAILSRKIRKVEKIMKKLEKEKKKDSKEYRAYERKVAAYKKEVGGDTTMKKKTKPVPPKSKPAKEDGEEKAKSRKSRSSKPSSAKSMGKRSSTKNGDAKKDKKEKRRSRSVGATKKDRRKTGRTSTNDARDKVKARKKKEKEGEKAPGSEP